MTKFTSLQLTIVSKILAIVLITTSGCTVLSPNAEEPPAEPTAAPIESLPTASQPTTETAENVPAEELPSPTPAQTEPAIQATQPVQNGSTSIPISTLAAQTAVPSLTPTATITYETDFETVWNAILAVLAERNESINTTNEADGLILTNQTDVSWPRLQEIASTGGREFASGGWYTLTFHLTQLAENITKVELEIFIVGTVPEMDNVWGGLPLDSNDTLEMEIFSAVTTQLQS
jgi:hypothetical protein